MSNEQQPPDEIWLQWHGDQEPEHCNGEPGEVTWSRDAVFRHDIEYRRVSGPSPEVLMRVIEMMMAYIDEERLQNVPIEKWIEQAEARIEAETKGGV